MKTDIRKIESEKRAYTSPSIECIKLDNQISLILNSFEGLPGDPNPDCYIGPKKENNSESPWA